MGLVANAFEKLTELNPQLEAQRRKTFPGMAHWAGSGPEGRTCRQCIFWTGCGLENGYYARRGMGGGTLKPRKCDKHRALMNNQCGPAVPHDAAACKYFDANQTPPAIVAK